MQPPVPVESIDRESRALDEAIARVEADIASAAPANAAPAAMPEPTLPPPSQPDGEPAPTSAPAPPAAPPHPAPPPPAPSPPAPPAVTTAVVAPAVAPAPVEPAAPSRAASVTPAPPRAATARPAADALNRIVAERGPVAPALRATRADEPAGAPAPARAAPLPAAPRLQVPSFTEVLDAEADKPAANAAPAAEAVTPAPPRDEVQRPSAPRPVTPERFNPRFLILALVGVLVVAGIAYAAWRLRDKPESLAKARAAMVAAQQAEQKNAKVRTRADDAGGAVTAPAPQATTPAPANPSQPAPGPSSSAAETSSSSTPALDQPVVAPAPSVTASPPSAPVQSAAPVTAALPAASTPAPDTTAAGPSAPSATVPAPETTIPVTQRAALLVDAPDDPQKVKTYVGTVIWSAENASPTQGNQPIARTVHANVDIPDAGLTLTLVLQKNFEAQFPASHTLDLRFTLTPSSAIGAIKEINVPQMRQETVPAGDPLIGLPVTITSNYFLVGLSRGDATARNLDLVKTRNWFDIPMVLTSGRVAKLTFEKGTTGHKVIDEVLQSWQ